MLFRIANETEGDNSACIKKAQFYKEKDWLSCLSHSLVNVTRGDGASIYCLFWISHVFKGKLIIHPSMKEKLPININMTTTKSAQAFSRKDLPNDNQ